MKRAVRVLLALVLLVTGAGLCAVQAQAATNLVRNAGFELGTQFWAARNAAVVSDDVYSGTKTGKLLPGAEGAFEQRIDGLSPNTRYTVSGVAKTDTLEWYLGVKHHGAAEANKKVTATRYTRETLAFTTGPDSRSATIYIWKPAIANTVHADDLQVFPTAALPGDVLINGGFESGAQQWAVVNGSVVADNVRTGVGAAKLTGSAGGFEQTVPVSANTSYTFSGFAKVDGQEVRIGVKGYGGAETNVAVRTTTYSQGTVTFTTGPTATSVVVYLFKPTTGNTAYGDDFSLVPTPAGTPQLWTENSLTSVFKDSQRTDTSGTELSLVAAKNEYEFGQVVLRSTGAFDITGVNLPELTSGVNKIAPENLRYKFVDYIHLKKNSALNAEEFNEIPVRAAPADFPDYLRNDKTRSVPGHTSQSIAITAYIPKATVAGVYSATITVSTTAGVRTVPLRIEVADVTIPDSDQGALSYANYTTLFGFEGSVDQTPMFYPGVQTKYSPEWWALMRKFAADMREHRMNTHYIPTVDLLADGQTTVGADGKITFNWSRFDEVISMLIQEKAVKRLLGDNFLLKPTYDTYGIWGLRRVNGSTVKQILPYGSAEAQSFAQQYLVALKDHLVTKGWFTQWTQLVGDEPASAAHAATWKSAVDNFIKVYAPGMKTATPYIGSPNDWGPTFEGRLSVHVPLLSTHENAKDYFRGRQAVGDEVWTYICNRPLGAFYNRLIDQPLSAPRFMNWSNFANGVTGTLHWAYSNWKEDPTVNLTPGDTAIVYPDPVNNDVTSTLRHDAMRDGIEEYELLKILSARDAAAAKRLATATTPTATYPAQDRDYLQGKHNQLVRLAAGKPASDPVVAVGDLIQAENFSQHTGVCRHTNGDVDGGMNVCGTHNGKHLSYDQVDFGAGGSARFDVRMASGVSGAVVTVRAGSRVLTQVNVPNTGSWQTYQTVRVPVVLPAGIHRVQLDFTGPGTTSLVHLNWLKFTPLAGNLARDAVASSSSQHSAAFAADRVRDDISQEHGAGEWASLGEQNPWVELRWNAATTVSKVVLFDRLNMTDAAVGGVLSFSNGTTVPVSEIRNDGKAKVVSFAPRSVTSVRFQVAGGRGLNVGLSELQVFGPDAVGPWSAPENLYAGSDSQTTGYAYAPSMVAGTTEYIYTCHSRSTATVRDDIFLTKRSGGVVRSSASVLQGTSGWDSFHNCDPSVVRVNVPFAGHTYSYAMFYLGNDVDASRHNQVGVAVADTLDGPWRKLPDPVVSYPWPDQTQWGVGQPAATAIDPAAGSVVLTWTEGSTAGNVGRFARVDFASGKPVLSQQHAIPSAGLVDRAGNPDTLNNFDLAYSPARDRFFMVREGHPYPSTDPNYISDHVQVLSIAGDDLWKGTGSWRLEGVIGSSVSGRARTHNPGFERTIYGTLPDESRISVVYTTSDPGANSLWSYRLWRTRATI